MKGVSVRTGGSNTGIQCRLKHIAGASGILTDDNASLMLFAVIPAEEHTDFKGMLRSQFHIGLTAKAVCTEIFGHVYMLLSKARYTPDIE